MTAVQSKSRSTSASKRAANAATVSLIVRHGDSGGDTVHTLNASHAVDVFAHVDRLLHLPPSGFELLCGGLLLRRDPLAKLPVPYAGAPLRVELIRYQDPAMLTSALASPSDSDHDHEDDHAMDDDNDARFMDSSWPIPFDEQQRGEAQSQAGNDGDDDDDECAQFTAAHAGTCSLTDKEHMLLTLVEMFEDLPTDIIVHATMTATSLDDAIEAALTLQALAASEEQHQDAESVSTAPSSAASSAATSSSSIDADLFSKYFTEPLAPPPAAPPFSPSPASKSTAKRKKKKKAASGTVAALGPPGGTRSAPLASPDMQLLLDMFPKHHASQLEVALHLHNNNVESAAAYLLGVPPNRAFKCDGGCGELGFPCLVHGTALMDDKALGRTDVKTWKVDEVVDDKVQTLMQVFPDRPVVEVKKVLDQVDGDVERASRVLAGDEVDEKAEKQAPGKPPSEARKSKTEAPLVLQPKPATAHDNPFAVLLESKRAHRVAAQPGFTRVTHRHTKHSSQPSPVFRPSKRDHRTPHAQAADHLTLPSLPNPSSPAVPLTTDDLYVQRAHRFAMARAALRRHAHLGGQVAGALADEGHALTAEIHARQRTAAWHAVAQQLQSHRSPWTVDLHGLTVAQAAGVVPEVVRRWWAAEHVTEDRLDVRAKRPLTLVVGVGNHSKMGQARLGPGVVKVVRGLGCRFVDESKGRGQVIVTGLSPGAVIR